MTNLTTKQKKAKERIKRWTCLSCKHQNKVGIYICNKCRDPISLREMINQDLDREKV